jgi:hypothetical protein
MSCLRSRNSGEASHQALLHTPFDVSGSEGGCGGNLHSDERPQGDLARLLDRRWLRYPHCGCQKRAIVPLL